MKLYAVTDASQLSRSPADACDALVALAREWAASGVDYIQIREKALPSRTLEALAARIMEAVRASSADQPPTATKVLVNGRADIALAVGADGVHLPASGALTPGEVVALFAASGRTSPVISVACHSIRGNRSCPGCGSDNGSFRPGLWQDAKVNRIK